MHLQSILRRGAVILAILAGVLIPSLAYPQQGFFFITTAVFAYTMIASIIYKSFPLAYCAQGFGLANYITLIRGGIICLLAGYISSPCNLPELLVILASTALALDGIDGWVARRLRQTSSFGARFDLEMDAAFVLILAILVYKTHTLSPWVLLIGFMRYIFALLSVRFPWLRHPLPVKLHRKIICNVQVVSLILCINPVKLWGSILWTSWLLAGALLLLLYSFISEGWWKYQHRNLR